MSSRISLFIDGSNFLEVTKGSIRQNIDPVRIIDWLNQKVGNVTAANIYFCIPTYSADRYARFIGYLGYSGFSVYSKMRKRVQAEDGSYVEKGNMNVELVMEMITTQSTYDIAVLVSGDGDFDALVRHLKACGKRVLVLSTYGMISRELRNAVGLGFIDIKSIFFEIQSIQKSIDLAKSNLSSATLDETLVSH